MGGEGRVYCVAHLSTVPPLRKCPLSLSLSSSFFPDIFKLFSLSSCDSDEKETAMSSCDIHDEKATAESVLTCLSCTALILSRASSGSSSGLAAESLAA